MFRIFVIIGGLIALILLTAFIAPFFIDWSMYRTNFEQQASRIIGHQVTVKGQAEARILPFPSLTFSEVEVTDGGAASPLLTVKKFSIFAELAPLLSGELHIIDMVLDEAVASANFDLQQQLNWTSRNNNIGSFNAHVDDVVLKNITIKNRTIKIDDQTNQHQHQLIDINATLSARSLLGPWHAEGEAIYNANELDEPLKFRMDTGAWSEVDKQMRLRLNIKPLSHPYQFKTTGILNDTEPHLQYDGTFQFDALNNTALKDFYQASSIDVTTKPLPIALKGDLTFKPSEITLPNFDLDIKTQNEPYRINGNATVSLEKNPSFKISAEGRQVDIERLKSELGASNSTTKPSAVSFSDHLSNLQNFLKEIPHAPIPGKIKISLPALTAGESIIRNLNLDFSQLDDGWEIAKFGADLPGRTKIRANGKLEFEQQMNFKGDMIVASSQPSGLANWIKGKIDPQVRALKKAGFAANVSLNDTVMRFDDLEIDVNGQILKGNLVRTAPINDSRANLQAELRGGTLDVNAMLAIAAMFTKETQGRSALDHDITLDLENDAVVYENYEAKNVPAELYLSDKNIDIKTLIIKDFIGTHLEIKGKVDDIFTSPDGQLSAHLKADNANRFLKFIDKQFLSHEVNSASPLLNSMIENSALSQDADFNLKLDADSETADQSGVSAIKLDVKGTMAQTQITADVSFTGDVQKPYDAKVALDSSLYQNQPYVLLQQLGLNALPVDLNMPATLKIDLKGIASNGLETLAELTLGDNIAKFNGTTLVKKETKPNFTGKSIVEVTDLQDIAFLSGIGIEAINDIDTIYTQTTDDGEPAKTIQFSANAKGTFETMTLNEISGKIYNNNFAGNIILERNKTDKQTVSGNLNLTHLSLPLLANWVFNPTADEQINASANPFDIFLKQATWSQASFGEPFLQSISGKIALTAKQMNLGGDEIASHLNTDLVLANGDIALQNAKMHWHDETILYDLSMKNAGGNGSGDGAFQLSLASKNMPVSKIFWQNTALNKPVLEGNSDINFNIETSGKSAHDMIKGLSGTAQIKIAKGTLNNLNSGLLNEIYPKIDKDGVIIDTALVTDTTNQFIYKNPYQFQMKPLEFTFAGGVARTNNIDLHDKNSQLLGDVKIDLVNATVVGNATLAINPGDERIKGSSPDIDFALNGALDAPVLTMDVAPLSNFLALRAFEIQRYKMEDLQAEISEKQRLKRAVFKIVAKTEERKRLEQLRLEAEARKKAEKEKLEEQERERLRLQTIPSPRPQHGKSIIDSPLPKLNVKKKARPIVDVKEKKRRKLEKLRIKYEHEINNRDVIDMEDLEEDANFEEIPIYQEDSQ